MTMIRIACALAVTSVVACGARDAASTADTTGKSGGVAHVARATFGTLPDSGGVVEQFTLTNAKGIEVRAIGYGAIITSRTAPTLHTSWWLRRHVQEDLP